MVIKQRAVSRDQKQERRERILDAARELFAGAPYEEISMLHVAERAVLAKGTLYLYFNTKEELFLALLAREIEDWFDEIDKMMEDLRSRGKPCPPEEFSRLLSQSLVSRPVAVRLIVISQAILEHNIDYTSALSYKQMLNAHIVQTGSILEECLPYLQPGQGARLILWIYLLVIGVQSVAEPAPVVQRTLTEPGMETFQVDFQLEISAILTVLLDGLAASYRRNS